MKHEDIQMLGFEIVAYAGDARSTLLEAVTELSKGNYERANELKNDASDMINNAHKQQVELLQKEVTGEPTPYSFIMMHGQDHLMTTMLLKDLVDVIETLYKKIDSII